MQRTILLAVLAAAPVAVAGTLAVSIVDENGAPVAARVYLTGADGKAYFAPGAVVYDRARPEAAERHFVPRGGGFRMELAAGSYRMEVERGKEYLPVREEFAVSGEGAVSRRIPLRRWAHMSPLGWYSADMHTHRPLADTAVLMEAEDLNAMLPISRWRHSGPEISEDPDLARFLKDADDHGVVRVTRERWFPVLNEELEPRSSALLVSALGRRGNLLEYPMADYALAARARGGLVDSEKATSLELPVIAALGGADLVGLANNHFWRSGYYAGAWGAWPDHAMRAYPRTLAGFAMAGFDIYYGLLNMGFPLQLSAGSASGVHPVPVGWSRVYVHVEPPLTPERWLQALRAGRSFVTTGPMLLLRVQGREPGQEVAGAAGGREVGAEVRVLWRKPVEAAEIVINGKAERVPLNPEGSGGFAYRGTVRLKLDGTSWIAARWMDDRGTHCDVAHTAPVWYRVPGRPLPAPPDQAAYFARRVEALIAEVESGKGLNMVVEPAAVRNATLQRLREALAVYRAKASP